ncbi:hypothetical protein HHI36_016575 [Cryptolaemus montrouzieri]|uniref:Uncharacterized protein n=1 Tax=Cryptolaemus montrouzieri TaxID=559131 RepID=A0ABD2NK60_9CUCU
MVGNKTNTGDKLKPVPKIKYIHVYRLQLETKIEDVFDYVRAGEINTISENSYEPKVLDVGFPDHKGQMVRVSVSSGKERSIVSDKHRPLTQGGDRLKKKRNAFRIRQAKIKANDNHILSSRNFAYSSWNLVNSFRNNSDNFQNSELDTDAFLNYLDSVLEAVAASVSNELMEDPINIMEQLTEEKLYFSFREVRSIIVRDVIRSLKSSRSKDV